MEFWSYEIFEKIGNCSGNRIESDQSFMEIGNLSVARFLLGLNPRDGLDAEIVLKKFNVSFIQPLDYCGYPSGASDVMMSQNQTYCSGMQCLFL